MIIAIDNISTGLATSPDSLGGMRMYLFNFLNSLLKWGPQHEYILFSPDWFISPFDQTISKFIDARIRGVPKNRAGRVFFEQVKYRKMIYSYKPDIFIGIQNSLPFLLKTPSLLFIKSVQYLLFPEAYNPIRLLYLKLMIRASSFTALKIIVPATVVGADLVRIQRIPPSKIETVPEALYIHDVGVFNNSNGSVLVEKIKQYTGNQPYVLCVGATYGYKNIERLIRAFAKFRHTLDSKHVLLLIGAEAGVSYKRIKAISKGLDLEDKVICCGSSPHDQVVSAYKLADMMVMPSLYETFGHPVLEAMACGCPVVTSNISAVAEVAGDAAALVDPYDIDSISNAMLRIAVDQNYRNILIDKGKRRAADFSWEFTAKRMLEVFVKTLSLV